MKISPRAKTKILGICTIIIGLWFFAITIIEIYLGKINISSKVGSGEISADKDAFFFWILIFIELFSGLTAAVGGVLMLLNKLSMKWKA